MTPAFLDACTLFGATLRDTLMRIAAEDGFQPQWSSAVLSELEGALIRAAGVEPEAAARVVAHMRHAFPDAEVSDYVDLIPEMTCEPKDRHVLAAAVAGGAKVLVTFNLKDFPSMSLRDHPITVVTPDAFLLNRLESRRSQVGRALKAQLEAAARPPLTLNQLLERLAKSGVTAFADEVRRQRSIDGEQ